MFKRLCVIAMLVGGSGVFVPSVQAISIDFVPANQTVGVNDTVMVNVVVSGLTAANEIVSAFDLDVTYDSSILTATGVVFGFELGDPFFFEAFTDFDLSSPGVVDFAELSLLSDSDLDALQGDSVTLAKLSFNAADLGTSPLSFTFDVFNDIKGRNNQVLDVTAGTGSVSAVPEPSTFFLLTSGLAGLVGLRMWKKRKDS